VHPRGIDFSIGIRFGDCISAARDIPSRTRKVRSITVCQSPQRRMGIAMPSPLPCLPETLPCFTLVLLTVICCLSIQMRPSPLPRTREVRVRYPSGPHRGVRQPGSPRNVPPHGEELAAGQELRRNQRALRKRTRCQGSGKRGVHVHHREAPSH
jgi:hypothetical protein